MHTLAFRNVLCAVDLLPESEVVVATAARLAGHLNADLEVLHVFTSNSPFEDRADWRGVLPTPAKCESLVRRMRDFVAGTPFPLDRARVSLRAGSPATQILHRASEVEADLIVIGRSGGGDEANSPGAITSAVSNAAPVLVVPKPVGGPHAQIAWGPFAQIVWAVESSVPCARAMELAVTLARNRGAGLLLMHVVEPLPAGADDADRAGEFVRVAIPDTSEPWIETQLMSAYGSRAHHIVAAANSRNADLIIIGEHRRASDGDRRTLRRVLRDARCPVLILDSSGSSAAPTSNLRGSCARETVSI
jgi:nucleotide-binding universal stress UspA family protein